jgi:hypothetical protein
LRAFLRPFAFDDGDAPAMRKSSNFPPDLIAVVNHRGFNPRPAHVSARLSGLRYLAATLPRAPHPKATFERAPPWKRVSLESPAWSIRGLWRKIARRNQTISGNIILKHSYDLSDQGVCERWIENPYWRHLTGGRVPSRALRRTSI